MAQRRLLTSGNAFSRTDGRWGGVVWYMDERGERKRKSFSGVIKAEINKKMTDYFRYLAQQELVTKNLMTAAPMIKKQNKVFLELSRFLIYYYCEAVDV